MVLARTLLPAEFGLIGMLTVFIGLGSALFEGGMTISLIRESSTDSRDYSTVFIFNLIVSILIYILFFLSAPYIAQFYNQPLLTDIARLYGLSFIFLAFGTVQNTILVKEMNFKKQAYLAFPSLVIGSSLGVYLAINNFGVWALVYSVLLTNFCNAFLLWITSDWRPNFCFDRDKFKVHFYFGYKMTISSLLDTIFVNIYQILIGRLYNPVLVGYYTRANSLVMLPVGNISAVLNKVIFPLFSAVENDTLELKKLYKKIMLMIFFIITPMIVLMILLSKEIVIILFTEKWLPIVPIFQILCLSGLLYPLHLYNLMILQVKGKSGLFLKLEIIKKIMVVIVVGISISFGFYGLLFGSVISSVIALFINTFYAGKFIQYKMHRQLIDLTPTLLISFIMAGVMYLLNFYLVDFNVFSRLGLIGTSGILTYLAFAVIFKNESTNEIIKAIKTL
jgi:teichuronic acid exporter